MVYIERKIELTFEMIEDLDIFSCAQLSKVLIGFIINMKNITQEFIKEHFSYKDGNLLWKKPTSFRKKIGDIAGRKNEYGNILITINKKMYSSARLIWLYHNGILPKSIEKKNGDTSDNRIENLEVRKKKKLSEITYNDLIQLFDYNNGSLIRKKSTARCTKKGSVAGWKTKQGYIKIEYNKKAYYAHRLVWMWHKGYLPENDIDHINQNKSDNRIENLREVSRSCNIKNAGNMKSNTSGVKGIHFYNPRKSWCVRISHNGKRKILGYPKDFNEAVLLRLAAEQCLNWGDCDSSSPAYQYALKHKLIKRK